MTAAQKLEAVQLPDPASGEGGELRVLISSEKLQRRRIARSLKVVTDREIELSQSSPEDPCGYFDIYTAAVRVGAQVMELDIDGSDPRQPVLEPVTYGLSSPYYCQ